MARTAPSRRIWTSAETSATHGTRLTEDQRADHQVDRLGSLHSSLSTAFGR
ncbi:hypothetical protein MA6G1108_5324 [Mycobacteroides abscessus 6G-1108]|nr:hypothetical protein MA6G1108_5324 [Mycobacteroides abscessus 6G-1108]